MADVVKNFNPPGAAANVARMLASDFISGPISHRFQVSIAKLIQENPGVDVFTIRIRGRGNSAKTLSGSYSLKQDGSGMMTMTGSQGSYVPSTSGTTNIGTMPTTYPIQGGADGSYSLGYPVIKTFTYTVSTQTLVVS